MLNECATGDSSKILEIEANLKGYAEQEAQQDQRVFLMLAAIFSGGATSPLSAGASPLADVASAK